MTCPECSGRGKNVALFCGRQHDRSFCHQRVVACRLCDGTGEIDAEQAARIAEGRRMRDGRVARGLSQNEEAKRLGITPQELSHREHGRQ